VSRPDQTAVAEAEEVLAHVRALRRELRAAPHEDAARSGLTGPQMAVMWCLVSVGSITLTELSARLGIGHSTASGIVDRLEARGLVRRIPDEDDRRRTLIAVTEAVTEYMRELEEGPAARLAVALESASAEKRRAILEGVTLLRELLTGSCR
jgi:DNA-binding MarR family transcriptional regulator